MSMFDDLQVVETGTYSTFRPSDGTAYEVTSCSFCSGQQMIVIARSHSGRETWLRCVNCGAAHVRNTVDVSPPVAPLRMPEGLPDGEESVWVQVRKTLAVGASTAAVMLCRKIILHVAVDAGLPEKNEKGWGPNFAQAIAYLEDEGVITKRMLPWVERIKNVGNDANHELPETDRATALDIAEFTMQLLVLYYEIPSKMAENEGSPS